MSALAQFQAMLGGDASGSDRAFDRGERRGGARAARALGIAVYPQDGSGVAADCAALVVSTAVEDQVPDVAERANCGVPIVHRSELLAHFVATHRTIAVTGTSGKSTVVAMIFEILRGAGRDPSVITGGDLALLQARGPVGQRLAGGSDLLVIEADESDGSLVRYAPAIGVVLNLQRDHKETAEVAAHVRDLRARTARGAGGRRGPEPRPLRRQRARCSAWAPRAAMRGEDVELGPGRQLFAVGGVAVHAARAGRAQRRERARGDRRVPGGRRAARARWSHRWRASGASAGASRPLGVARGVEVIDDFAHNPAKIAAALSDRAARRAKARARGLPAARLRADALPARGLRRHVRPRTRARTTGCGCSRCSTPAARRRATSPRPTS